LTGYLKGVGKVGEHPKATLMAKIRASIPMEAAATIATGASTREATSPLMTWVSSKLIIHLLFNNGTVIIIS